jgi:ferrous iron transport protein A
MSNKPLRHHGRKRWRRREGSKPKGPANLDTLPLGTTGIVLAITGERELRRRLMEMGLLEGSRLRVVKFAPTGDPIEIQVNDYFLSLRREEAARIVVMPQVRSVPAQAPTS